MTHLLLAAAVLVQDPASDADKAIKKLRGEKSYRTKFKATIEAPGSDPLVVQGESVWVKPGVLYIQYLGSGGDNKRIIRVGDKVWVYHELLADWVSGEEMGTPGAGRGVQNPDEVLAVLLKYAQKAKTADGALEIGFAGGDIETIMKEQANSGSFDWRKSKAAARLFLKAGEVHRFTSTAELISVEESLRGKIVKYSAEVEIVNTSRDTSLKFTIVDERTKRPVEVPVPPFIEKEISGYLVKKP